MYNFFAALFSLLVITTGCMTVRVPEARQEKEITALAEKLSSLSAQVNPDEAHRVAEVAVRYPLVLAREWHATPPAVIEAALTGGSENPPVNGAGLFTNLTAASLPSVISAPGSPATATVSAK